MPARIAPARPPFPASVQERLDRITPAGREPLVLFTTLARDERLMERFFAGGLLDRGHLTIRQREIVIDRMLALDADELDTEQLKWVVLMVLSSQPGQEAAFQRLEDLVSTRTGAPH